MDKLIEQFHQLSDTIRNYTELLNRSGFSGNNPDADEFIQSRVISASKLTNDDITIDQKKRIESIFKVYSTISMYLSDFTLIYGIFNTYRITEMQIGSSSSNFTITDKYINDLTDRLESVEIALAYVTRNIQSIQLEIMLVENINQTADEIKLVDEISAEYKKYVSSGEGIYCINLYFAALNKLYDLVVDKPGKTDIVKHINAIIQNLKTDLLTTEQYQIEQANLNIKNRIINSIQNMIQTYKLTPVGAFDNIKNILHQIEIKASGETIDEIITNAHKSIKKKIGFIVINKTTRNPLEHRSLQLIESDLPANKNLKQPSIYGVNDKTIERTNTIVVLSDENQKQKNKKIKNKKDQKNQILIIGQDASEFYILQTLDGLGYCFMTLWGANGKPAAMPSSMLDINDNGFNPSEKLEKYNSIINDSILDAIHKPFIENSLTGIFEIKREDAYWNSVKQKVKTKILQDYKEYLENLKQITLATCKKMVLDDARLDREIRYITELAMRDFAQNTDKLTQSKIVLEQFKAELAIAWLAESNTIERRYKSTLEELISDNNKQIERVFNVSDNNIKSLINKVIDALDPVIDEHLKQFINRKSGIFITIQNCLDVMEKTLLK